MDSYRAVSFDLGQTLVELDADLLSRKLSRWGYTILPESLDSAIPEAWRAYNQAKRAGKVAYLAWRELLSTLLGRAGIRLIRTGVPPTNASRDELITRLWEDQPRENLWQRPVPGMFELIEELANRAIVVGVLTNSEGRAKELVDALGLGRWMATVVDSGVEGIEKPHPQLFDTMAKRLGYPPSSIVHIGDSFEADVRGALGAGMIPVWFMPDPELPVLPGVHSCHSVRELADLLLG